MVRLFCAIVGVAGSAFEVKIDDAESVSALKDAIWEKIKEMFTYDDKFRSVVASRLHLFLAKQPVEDEGGEEVVPVYRPSAEEMKEESLKWLPDEHRAALKLVKGESDDYINALTAGEPILGSKTLRTWFYTKNNMELPSSEQVHVLVVVPEQAQGQPGLWLVTGSVDNALNTKGIRCRLYRLAGLYLGYYDPVRRAGDKDSALWYEGKTLCIHSLFETKENALLFDNALQDDSITAMSPLNGHAVSTNVAPVSRELSALQRIYSRHYVPEDTESPQATMISLSSNTSKTSIVDVVSDEFKYQRIESEVWFDAVGKAQSCHLMSRDHCEKFTSYNKYANDPSNRLALSAEMHEWFDARSFAVPTIKISVESTSERFVICNRYQVNLVVRALNANFAKLLALRLKEGFVVSDDGLEMRTSVYVLNKKVFCECMEWKRKEIEKRWRAYYDMAPAVD